MTTSLDRLRDGAVALTPRQRYQLGVAVLALVGLLWGISTYATRVRWGVLYSQLERDDAAAVTDALRESQIPYRLGAGGRTIEVPADRVDDVRLQMAGEGLPPGGGVGFEIFDKPAFGLSDFVQNVNYRRALERELARTIQTIDAVHSARVHLALPPESVFADEKREPRASVVVRLRPGSTLANGQVRAISHLVASGVENLQPTAVSVIDGEGRMLSTNGEDQGLSASQQESKRTIERSIESTLVSILEPVVGSGRVRARATVELNLARVERVEESFDPDRSVVRSEQKSRTRQGSGGTGGIPGTASNLPGGGGGATAGASQQQEAQTSTTNFEISRTTSTIAEPVGTLSRQSIAVVVDHALGPLPTTETADGAPAVRPALPRSPEEMTKITDLVRAAIGLDERRGDLLIVENIPFDGSPGPGVEDEPAGIDWAFWLSVARYASLPLAVLLLALLVIRPGIAVLRGVRQQTASPSGLPPTIGELQARLRGELPGGGGISALVQDLTPLKRKLIEAANEDPKTAALVIKRWLEQNRDRG
jgi:flagellar M-ring protein FliF